MRRLATAFLVLMLCAARAEAVTVKEIIDLARAGLGDEVLIALIEVDGGVFNIDKATLTSLKTAGLSDRVIEALVRSGRSRPVEPPPPAPVVDPEPPPPVVVIERERPVIQEVVVPVPVYVPVPVVPVGSRLRARGHAVVTEPFDPSPGFGVPSPPLPGQHLKRAEPVYWGWGGKLRPDAWKPAPDGTVNKDNTDRKR